MRVSLSEHVGFSLICLVEIAGFELVPLNAEGNLWRDLLSLIVIFSPQKFHKRIRGRSMQITTKPGTVACFESVGMRDGSSP